MRLRELQRSFQNRVLRHRHGIEAQLNGVDAEDFDSRLNAYVEGYRTRLIEALASTYPVLKATLGEDEFEREMRLYIDSTDSCHFSIRPYGADLAQRLQGHSSRLPHAALAELAAWEWLLADVFRPTMTHWTWASWRRWRRRSGRPCPFRFARRFDFLTAKPTPWTAGGQPTDCAKSRPRSAKPCRLGGSSGGVGLPHCFAR